MRKSIANGKISVQAVAGTHVIMLCMDVTEEARKGLLGFSIIRKNGAFEKKLRGFQYFKGEETKENIIQSFIWSDYQALPGITYTYEITPNYGTPQKLEKRESIEIIITSEKTDDGVHGVFFNRGVAGSQAYKNHFGKYQRNYMEFTNLDRDFGDKSDDEHYDIKWKSYLKPSEVPDGEAYDWLSRGLEEGLINFIQQAKDSNYALHASIYEFSYVPIIREFLEALGRGVDVKIVHEGRRSLNRYFKTDEDKKILLGDTKDSSNDNSEVFWKKKTIIKNYTPASVPATAYKILENTGIPTHRILSDNNLKEAFETMLIKRTEPSISHNKFIVLLKKDEETGEFNPIQVWTGSTNLTAGGIFGQSNVGHQIRDEEVAKSYHDYWLQLKENPKNSDLRDWTVDKSAPEKLDDIPDGMTPVFSPRNKPKGYSKQVYEFKSDATEEYKKKKTIREQNPKEHILEWYAALIGKATHSIHLTSAFTISSPFLFEFEKKTDPDNNDSTPYLRYVLLEGDGGALRDKIPRMSPVQLNRLAWGDTIKSNRNDELELLTGLNHHVNYVHTKYMLIDPLTDDPIVITGSANFSDASTFNNDENMVIIRGNTRVADIFLTEFMRLFNHFKIRNEINALFKAVGKVEGKAKVVARAKAEAEAEEKRYLKTDDSWTNPYFDEKNQLSQERMLFGVDPELVAKDAPAIPELDLDYFMFDWDDNILFMPTLIHLEKDGKHVEVTTKEFATIRQDKSYQITGDSFREFRDGTGDFVSHTRIAIAGKRYAPSYKAFKKALREARLFCIVTARGHSSATLRKGVEWFIKEAMSSYERHQMMENIQKYNRLAGIEISEEECLSQYLDLNGYVGVSSPEFLKAYQAAHIDKPEGQAAASPEEKKTAAVSEFVERTLDLADKLPSKKKKISFGFSDDDLGNLSAMREYIKDELKKEYENVEFFVFDTSGNKIKAEKV